MSTEDSLRHPPGPFQRPSRPLDDARRREMIDAIARTPSEIRTAIRGLSDSQLDTPYRPGGWTVRQVVHHVPDSHMNAFIRFKLALTEDTPTIKPYKEAEWAKLADAAMPVDVSLNLLESVHARWVAILKAMTPEQWA